MKIETNKVVSIEYILKDADGTVIDSSEKAGPLDYLHGRQNLIPGLEKQLEGKEPGSKITAVVEPAEGYGEYDPKLVTTVPRSQFDPSIKIQVGMSFQAESNAGPVVVHVVKVEPETITVDANHELAGKTLYFEVEVKDVHDATPEQIEAGSLYTGGCGGCSSCGGGCGGSCGGDHSDSCGGGSCHSCSGGCH